MNEPIRLTELAELYLEQSDITTARGERAVRVVPERLRTFLGRDATTADLTIETARAWLVFRAESVGEAAVREDAKKLLTLWRWLAVNDLVPETLVTPKHLMPQSVQRYARNRPDPPEPIVIEPCEETAAEWVDGLIAKAKAEAKS